MIHTQYKIADKISTICKVADKTNLIDTQYKLTDKFFDALYIVANKTDFYT